MRKTRTNKPAAKLTKRGAATRLRIIEGATEEALRREWANGLEARYKEGALGATRFAGGKGRHGSFVDIV